MSTVQSSPYLPMVMAAPPPSCTETLDQFLPIVPSPLGEPSQSPGREDTTKLEIVVFVVEASTESPSARGVKPIKSADQTYRERDHLRSMMYHRHRGRPCGYWIVCQDVSIV